MKATIQTVAAEMRSWEGPNGTLVFISGSFTDSSDWSVGTKPEYAEERRAQMTALIGQEGEFELEAKPDYNGHKVWKMKSWPGKPAGRASGGGGSAPSWRNTEPGARFEQRQMNRRTSLMQAVAAGGELSLAETFYAWLEDVAGEQAPFSGPFSGRSSPAGTTSEQASTVPVSEEAGGPGPSGEAHLGPPAPTHEHVWGPSPTLTKFNACAVPGCLAVERKA